MIEPWQVWDADLAPEGGHTQLEQPVLVVSSAFHIRLNVGRTVNVLLMSSQRRELSYRVPVTGPDGHVVYVNTDQVTTIPTLRFVRTAPSWSLADEEVAQVRRSLRNMVDL